MAKLNTLKFVVYVQVVEELLPTLQVYRITISKDNRLSLCRKEPAVYGGNHMKYCVDQVTQFMRALHTVAIVVKALSEQLIFYITLNNSEVRWH